MLAARMNSCRWCHFDVGVGVAPQEREAGKPILGVNRLPDASSLFLWQEASGSGEFGSGDSSSDGAGGDLDLRVIAYAFDLPQFAVGHKVEFVVVFGEPDRRVNGAAALSEGREADVSLAVNFDGYGSHAGIVIGNWFLMCRLD
jgi:hypothetical protein